MSNFQSYMLGASFCMALFYGFFHFVLKNETFHNLLRTYILLAIVASLVIPAVPYSLLPTLLSKSNQQQVVPYNLNRMISDKVLVAKENKPSEINNILNNPIKATTTALPVINERKFPLKLSYVLLLVYFIGVMFFSLRFLFNIYGLIRLIRKNDKSSVNGIKICYMKADTPSFSFLNYVFISKNSLQPNDEKHILAHECIHIHHWHSFDILFIEIIKIAFWFNPFIWFFKASMVKLHEFYADEKIVNRMSDPNNYKELLLRHHLGKYNLTLAHPFNHSLLKTRIAMINKVKSKKIARLKLILAIPVLAIGLLAFTNLGSSTSKSDNKDSKTSIEKLMDYYMKSCDFSGNILVYKNNELIYEKSHGYADYKSKQKLNINTPFLLGTATESFTSVAIMILKEENKLNYSDSLAQYFNDLPSCMGPVTIQQLLNHTSGIPTIDDYWPCESGATTNKSMYEFFKKMDQLYFKPGTDFRGSQSGYILLALIIEKVSHQSYEQFIKENILSPTGMKDTYFLNEQNFYGNNRAIGFKKDGTVFDYPQFTMGNSGIVTTVFDLRKFETNLYAGEIVSLAELKKAQLPIKLADGREIKIGSGFELFGNQGENITGHYSWFGGTKAIFWDNLDKQYSIIALTNNSWVRFTEMVAKISRILENKPYKLPADKDSVNIDEAMMKKMEGMYKLDKHDFRIKINLENNKPYVSFYPFEESYRLYASSKEQLFIKEFDLQFELHKNRNDSVISFTLKSDEDAIYSKISQAN